MYTWQEMEAVLALKGSLRVQCKTGHVADLWSGKSEESPSADSDLLIPTSVLCALVCSRTVLLFLISSCGKQPQFCHTGEPTVTWRQASLEGVEVSEWSDWDWRVIHSHLQSSTLCTKWPISNSPEQYPRINWSKRPLHSDPFDYTNGHYTSHNILNFHRNR